MFFCSSGVWSVDMIVGGCSDGMMDGGCSEMEV